jgi:transcriptional regulator with XRE-family HTH domain
MSEKKFDQPYRALGLRLKVMREKLKESLAEVSGAVEIDEITMELYERGSKRPSEEILMLLLNHFDTKEDDALRLWELAGYTQGRLETHIISDDTNVKPIAMVIPMDNRVIYTDMVNVTVNDYGVVLNFMQNNGPDGQPNVVSRIGMSKDHAHSVLKVIEQTMQHNEQSKQPKFLNPPTEQDKQN